MSEKRKDHKGRLLKTGESQRKDKIYQYRYTDPFGRRQTIYASSLQKLREEEAKIAKMLDKGCDYQKGSITVLELLKRMLSLKGDLSPNTKLSYATALNNVEKELFGQRMIRDIKTSEAKQWVVDLRRRGYGYSSVAWIVSTMRQAFEMAFCDDIINKNPFSFSLKGVISNDSPGRVALTKTEQEIWLDFIKNDSVYHKYYDEFVILLGTGMRISEFCGLTEEDIDFRNRKIRVERQLQVNRETRELYISEPKTKAGIRFIPMSEEVASCLQRVLDRYHSSKKTRLWDIDGHCDFIFRDSRGNPRTGETYSQVFRSARKRFNRQHPDITLPKITPHILRHTFCTNLAQKNISVKALQYIMGHANVNVTLSVYSHQSFDHAAQEFDRLWSF